MSLNPSLPNTGSRSNNKEAGSVTRGAETGAKSKASRNKISSISKPSLASGKQQQPPAVPVSVTVV